MMQGYFTFRSLSQSSLPKKHLTGSPVLSTLLIVKLPFTDGTKWQSSFMVSIYAEVIKMHWALFNFLDWATAALGWRRTAVVAVVMPVRVPSSSGCPSGISDKAAARAVIWRDINLSAQLCDWDLSRWLNRSGGIWTHDPHYPKVGLCTSDPFAWLSNSCR